MRLILCNMQAIMVPLPILQVRSKREKSVFMMTVPSDVQQETHLHGVVHREMEASLLMRSLRMEQMCNVQQERLRMQKKPWKILCQEKNILDMCL